MKATFQTFHKILNHHKSFSICVFLFLMLFVSCENLHLGLPGNALSQAEQALDAQKKAMAKMSGFSKKELIQNKSEMKKLLTKAEPFLARRANEIEVTELLLTQDHLKKSQEALLLYLDARTQAGKDSTTSEMTRALNQASESINSAEDTLSKFKSKQPENKD